VVEVSGWLPTLSSVRLDGARFYYHQFNSTNTGYFPETSVGFFSTAGGTTTTLSTTEEHAGWGLSDYTYAKPLAVDDANAYWFCYLTGDHAQLYLRSAPKDGGGTVTTLNVQTLDYGSNQGVVGLAVDASYLYWLREDNGIYRLPKAGSISATPELLQALPGESTDTLVLVAGWLYWASTVNGQIWRYDVSGGAAPSYVDALSSGGSICGLAVDGSSLYWAQCSAPYEVHRVGVDGTGAELLASPTTDSAIGSTTQGGVVVDQDYAYFLGSHDVHRVPKGGGQEEAIGYTQPDTTASDYYDHRLIGVDSQNVYLFDMSLSSVLRLAK
jgi:hypothetical protein